MLRQDAETRFFVSLTLPNTPMEESPGKISDPLGGEHLQLPMAVVTVPDDGPGSDRLIIAPKPGWEPRIPRIPKMGLQGEKKITIVR